MSQAEVIIITASMFIVLYRWHWGWSNQLQVLTREGVQ
jgi:hypothetical protein